MPVIYHIADIHITNSSERDDEYTKVFDKLYKILEADNEEKIIVLAGDLFDSKITFKTYALTTVSTFVSNLVKYGELILFDGNHDVNMSNSNVESTIKSMLTLSEKLSVEKMERIHYLNENKIYRIAGINFGLTTVHSRVATRVLPEQRVDGELYIGLYHGKVYGAKTDLGFRIDSQNSNFSTSDFSDYDIVCLGDIHKHQFLDENKRIAYSSSLVQKDFGESVSEHGVIRWDLDTLDGKFIPIHNEYCMINCTIHSNNLVILGEQIDLNDYSYIKARITYKRDEQQKIAKYEKMLRKKFNFKEITMYEECVELDNLELGLGLSTGTSTSTNTGTGTNKNSLCQDMRQVITDFVEKTSNDESTKNDIKKIMIGLIDSNDLNMDRKTKKIELCTLEFDNLFCYGTGNKIDFTKLSKINGISADNGYGKSSLIDVILYTMYQKCARTKNTGVLNKFKTDSWAKLTLKVNDVLYEIERKIVSKKTSKAETLKIYKNGENITGEHKNSSKEILEDIFGSYEEMIDNNIMLQHSDSFIMKTEKSKKDVMYKIFGIEPYDRLFQLIKNKILELKKQRVGEQNRLLSDLGLTDIKNNIQQNISLLRSLEVERDVLSKKILEQSCDVMMLDDLRKKYPSYNANTFTSTNMGMEEQMLLEKTKSCEEKISRSNALGLIYTMGTGTGIGTGTGTGTGINLTEQIIGERIIEERMKIKPIQTVGNIEHIKNTYEQNLKFLENYKIQLSNISDIENFPGVGNIEKTRGELNSLKILLNKVEENKAFLKDYMEENKNLLDHRFNSKCADCKHNKDIHKKINYRGKIETIENFIKENQDVGEKIKVCEANINVLEKVAFLKTSIDKLEEQNNNLKPMIDLYNSVQENVVSNNVIENNIRMLNELNGFVKELSGLRVELGGLEKMKDIILTIRELEERVKDLDAGKYREAGIKTQIKDLEKHNVIMQTKIDSNEQTMERIKDINNEIMRYENASKIFSEDCLIEKILNRVMENAQTVANNVLKDLCDFTLGFDVDENGIGLYKIYKGEKIDARYLSGYEMFVSNIAIRISFGKLQRNTKSNFMIIDEGFSSCSIKNIMKMNCVFDVIRKNYSWCMVVSHLEQIRNNFDYTYEIKKVKDDSLVII